MAIFVVATPFTVDTESLIIFVCLLVTEALTRCHIVMIAKLKKIVACPALITSNDVKGTVSQDFRPFLFA